MKINKSQIVRELEVDRRTVDKYINGYQKPENRNCDNCITPYYTIIEDLLSDRKTIHTVSGEKIELSQ